MPIPVSNSAERNVYTDAPKVITVSPGVATLILLDETNTLGDISQRLIQNTGSNPCFYSENMVDNTKKPPTPICDGILNYHGSLNAGEQLDCSSHRQAVCVYSSAGTVVSTTIRRRLT